MEALTSVLTTLKIDSTIWIQLGCFLVSYIALSNLIFKPYYKVYLERNKRTVGGEEHAEKMVQETAQLNEKFASRTREINSEFKTIYDAEKASASKVYNQKITDARGSTQEMTESVRTQIVSEVKKAQGELEKEIPFVSGAIASKLTGKEVTL